MRELKLPALSSPMAEGVLLSVKFLVSVLQNYVNYINATWIILMVLLHPII